MDQPLPDKIHQLMYDLASGLRSILGDRLIGVYLGGSLSLGDFCAATSDLDFLVVTVDDLDPEDLLAIGMFHRELLAQNPAAVRLEGDYAPVHALIPSGTSEPVPGCERGIFLPKVGEIMLSADNIYNMRENGITITGPDPRQVLPAVSPELVRSAVRSMLEEGPVGSDSPEEMANELLNLFRSLYAMEIGRPITKSQGVEWVRSRVEDRWLHVIEAAVTVRKQGRADHWNAQITQAARELDQLLRSRFHEGQLAANWSMR